MRKRKDVEFQIKQPNGNLYTTHSFPEACAMAVGIAASGRAVELDVLIYSAAGARAWGGPEGAAQYKADPDASVHDRIVIRAESLGRVY